MQIKSRRNVRTFSHSEVSSLLTCPLRHDLSYSGHRLGCTLKAKVAAPILRDGRAWGALVAAWHQTGDLVAAEFAMEASLIEDANAMTEFGIPVEVVNEQIDDTRKFLLALLDHYMRTPQGERIFGDRPEHKMVVAIPSRSGRRSSNRYALDTRLDLVETDEHGDWIVEFKLRGQLTPAHILHKQQQIRWYAWAWRKKTGRDIVGVIVDERLKAMPNPPRMVKAKKQSDAQKAYKAECKTAGIEPDKDRLAELGDLVPSHAVDQLCEVHEYEANCRQHGVEPEPDTLLALGGRKWGQRERVFFRRDEMAATGRQLVSAAKHIADADAGNYEPLPNASTRTCNGCQFRDVCDDLDNAELVDSLFDRRQPRRDAGKVAA